MDNFHEEMERITGIPKSRQMEIERDVLFKVKLDPAVKTISGLLEMLMKNYKDKELVIACYAAGLIIGVDRVSDKKAGFMDRLTRMFG